MAGGHRFDRVGHFPVMKPLPFQAGADIFLMLIAYRG